MKPRGSFVRSNEWEAAQVASGKWRGRKMTRAYTKTDKIGPLWAVFGAPLVGVPLMVGILALGSGTPVDTASAESEAGFALEQVEMPEIAEEAEAEAPPGD
jgi:hypothetical protein